MKNELLGICAGGLVVWKFWGAAVEDACRRALGPQGLCVAMCCSTWGLARGGARLQDAVAAVALVAWLLGGVGVTATRRPNLVFALIGSHLCYPESVLPALAAALLPPMLLFPVFVGYLWTLGAAGVQPAAAALCAALLFYDTASEYPLMAYSGAESLASLVLGAGLTVGLHAGEARPAM